MSSMYGFSREAIRVKVKKCEGVLQPEFRKFSVDPQITSFEVLQSILAKAFDLKGEFTICYRLYDVYGHETYMPLLSDWDLDAAFLKAYNTSVSSGAEPCLSLRVDLKPFEECSDDWDIPANVPVITQIRTGNAQEAKPSPRLHGLIMNQVEKTFIMVQRALNLSDENNIPLQPPRPPLSDSEFRKFLDPVGQIVHAKELRSVIYFGGIDPSLRKVVWKHILNVYPEGMSGRERMDYIRKKASEYIVLRDTWRSAVARGPVAGELAYTTGMVRKDVLRTDRHHRFYAGSDDNQNIASLFNILTTYALNHPKVSYCQGMSDLASPLLVTMGDEAHAYICFCALMSRLSTNFMLDGIAMTQKFTHLAEGLLYYDTEFYNYLKSYQADDLLFCYRWLLLEMKREFAFEDSLRMLEVLWSSLPSSPPDTELKLFDVHFQPPNEATPPISPLVKTPRENAYTKVCALRRQSSSVSLASYSTGTNKAPVVKRQNHSLDETTTRAAANNYNNDVGGGGGVVKHQSLDDASLMTACTKGANSTELRPRSVSPLEQKSDSTVLNSSRAKNHVLLAKSKSASLSSSMSNLMKSNKKSGHFRDLKERLANKAIFSSLDKLDSAQRSIREESEIQLDKLGTGGGKVIKNLNEFLNFAAVSRNKIADNSSSTSAKISAAANSDNDKPLITLTKSSFDDSESSSVDCKHQHNTTTTTTTTSSTKSVDSCDDTFDGSSPDDSQEYFPMTTSITRELRLELENLDRQVFGGGKLNEPLLDADSPSTDCDSKIGDCACAGARAEVGEMASDVIAAQAEGEGNAKPSCLRLKNKNDDVFVWENPLHQTSPAGGGAIVAPKTTVQNYPPTPDEQADLEYDTSATVTAAPELTNGACKTTNKATVVASPTRKLPLERTESQKSRSAAATAAHQKPPETDAIKAPLPAPLVNSCEELTEAVVNNKNSSSAGGGGGGGAKLLPPPQEFGGGNPFLMFLCVTVLLQHRDVIIRNRMDYNEMAMHFDKMVRKHNVTKVLNQARQLYAGYIKQHTMAQQNVVVGAFVPNDAQNV